MPRPKLRGASRAGRAKDALFPSAIKPSPNQSVAGARPRRPRLATVSTTPYSRMPASTHRAPQSVREGAKATVLPVFTAPPPPIPPAAMPAEPEAVHQALPNHAMPRARMSLTD